MLPSRGLRPLQFAPLASRQALFSRSSASRKFSSGPRKTLLAAPSCRTSPLRSAGWRAGATTSPNVLLTASSVRNASWYAPWTWIPPPADAGLPTATTSELAPEPAPIPEPVVTTSTPELAPAGIDQAAVVDASSSAVGTAVPSSPQSMDELLGLDPAAPVVDSASIVDPTALVTYWGNLKDMGLDFGWGPTAVFQNLMELSYLHAGVGWAGAIAVSSIALRMVLFFTLQVRGSDSTAKLAAMKPLLQPIMDDMEKAKQAGDEEKAQQLKMKQAHIMKEAGGDLGKSLGTGLAQGVFGFGAFRCLRGMSELPVAGMSSDGWLWFTDLTISDPYYVLPALTGGLMYAIIKMGGETGMATETQTTSFQKQLQVVMPVVITAVSAFQPAALQLYFVFSTILGSTTAFLLRQPKFRSLMKIQQMPSKESNELFKKVVKGEVKLSAIRGADGKIRYQAPNASASPSPAPSASHLSSKTTLPSGINIKAGTALPLHMRAAPAKINKKYADRDADYELGPPAGADMRTKMDWVRRNYRPTFMGRSLMGKLRSIAGDSRELGVIMEEKKKERAKEAAKRYEVERKRRFEGR